MLIYVYVFALVLGAILLGASFLLGGDDADLEADGDLDVDADVDADADFSPDGDLDGHDGAGHSTSGDLVGLFGVLTSLRFWTFFGAFFGLTGLMLDGLGLADSVTALIIAIAVGGVSGWGAVTLIRHLSANDTGVAAGVDDYVGKTGEVLLPVGPGRVGKLRIELKGTTVDVLARSEQSFARGEQALIIEMDGTTAVVHKIGASAVTTA